MALDYEHEHDISACGDCQELEKLGGHIAAEKLLAIAKTGQHREAFGGRKLEAAAQEIMRLWERVRSAEQRARQAETKGR